MKREFLTKRNIVILFVSALISVVCTALIFTVFSASEDQGSITGSAALETFEISDEKDLKDAESVIETMDFDYLMTDLYETFEEATL